MHSRYYNVRINKCISFRLRWYIMPGQDKILFISMWYTSLPGTGDWGHSWQWQHSPPSHLTLTSSLKWCGGGGGGWLSLMQDVCSLVTNIGPDTDNTVAACAEYLKECSWVVRGGWWWWRRYRDAVIKQQSAASQWGCGHSKVDILVNDCSYPLSRQHQALMMVNRYIHIQYIQSL